MEKQAISADQYAYNYILGEIRSGRMAGGARLKSEEIAKTIGLSRIPIRGAIKQLESEGFVTIRPNRGAVVTELGPEEIGELFEIRSVLEGLAARLAVPRMNNHALADLRDLLSRLNRAHDDIDLWVRRHFEFHQFICSFCGRRRLISEIERLSTLCEPYMRLWYNKGERRKKDLDEHLEIIQALKSGDAVQTEAVMREHIERGAVQLRTFFYSNASTVGSRKKRRAG